MTSAQAELRDRTSLIQAADRAGFLQRLSTSGNAKRKRGQRLGLFSLAASFLLALRIFEPDTALFLQGQQISSIKSIDILLFFGNSILYMLAAIAFVDHTISHSLLTAYLARDDKVSTILAYSYGAASSIQVDHIILQRAVSDNDRQTIIRWLVIRLCFLVSIVIMLVLVLFPPAINIYFLSVSSLSAPLGRGAGAWFAWLLVVGQLAAFVGSFLYNIQYGAADARQEAKRTFMQARSRLRPSRSDKPN